MTTSRDKPLSDWTDDELQESLRAGISHVAFSPADLSREIERRRVAGHDRLILWATVAAAVAAVASAVTAIVSLARP